VRTLTALARLVESLSPGPSVAGLLLFTDRKGRLAVAETIVSADVGTIEAHVRFLDAGGNETTPDTTPTWASSDETVATVEADEDGLSATVTVVGKAGAAVVAVETTESETGDTIHCEGTLTVQASDVTVSGEVTFDVPTPEQH
jgi:uncharacterized protein YjdB